MRRLIAISALVISLFVYSQAQVPFRNGLTTNTISSYTPSGNVTLGDTLIVTGRLVLSGHALIDYIESAALSISGSATVTGTFTSTGHATFPSALTTGANGVAAGFVKFVYGDYYQALQVYDPLTSNQIMYLPNGTGTDTLSTKAYARSVGGGGGVTDHGALAGLGDDDHTQYAGISQSESITGTWTLTSGLLYVAQAGALRWWDNGLNYYSNFVTSGDWTGNQTVTIPEATGTLITTGNLSSITATGTVTTGTWNGTTVGTGYGGTGLTSFTANGIMYATSTSALTTASNLKTDGSKVTSYNAVATEGYGVPAITDQVSLTAQASSIGATSMTNTATAGNYRVSVYLSQYQSDLDAGTVYCTISWREPKNTGYVSRSEATTTINFYTTNVTHKTFYLSHEGSASMTYATTVSGIVGSDKYALWITVERLN